MRTHPGSIMLKWLSGVGGHGNVGGEASSLGLGFSIPDESTENDSSYSMWTTWDLDCFHRCIHRHTISYLKAFVHVFKKYSLSVDNVPGTVVEAGNTAGDKRGGKKERK